MKSKLLVLGGLIYTLFLFSACRPGGAEYIDQLDLVGTAYSKEANFQSKKTYSISDKVLKVNSSEELVPEYMDPSAAAIIINRINSNMKAYGWTLVDTLSNPDVNITNAVMTSTTVYYSYGYYGGYYGYGWYYPGYYPPTYSTVTTGTVLTQMADRRDSSIDGRLPIIWVSVINGLAEGSGSSFPSRANKTIDQAFKQSPILNLNN